MPVRNGFRHQSYPASPALSPVLRMLERVEPVPGLFPELHAELQVGRVILVPGTFMGDDPFGLAEILKAMGDSSPLLKPATDRMAEGLLQHTRPFMENLTSDTGNYTSGVRDLFQRLVGDDPQVELLNPPWSGQNHHLARADLAVRLIHQLLERPLPEHQRVLLWGHSHAGNAFALMTNLLSGDPSVSAFFDAAGPQPGAHWAVVRDTLLKSSQPHPLSRQILIAGFSTPVRYGWDLTGCRGLVLVTFHRPYDAADPFKARPMFPPYSLSDTVNATWGDWVQSFAICGTDVPTMPTRSVNQQLATLLEGGLAEPQHGLDTRLIAPKRVRDACFRWKSGTRCHADGRNVLVDYEPSGEMTSLRRPLESALLGHGVATTAVWLPAHLQLVIEQLRLSLVDQQNI